MSRTFEIVCHDCEIALWVGQGNPGREYIYKTPEALQAMQDFLFIHQRHRLEFGDDEIYEYDRVGEDPIE